MKRDLQQNGQWSGESPMRRKGKKIQSQSDIESMTGKRSP